MKTSTVVLLIWATTLLLGVLGTDFYEVLQVARNAGEDQIKRAYKKLALQYHPDKVKGTDEEKRTAEQRFQEISQAYSVLSDTEKRRIYDRYGEEGLNQQGSRGGSGMFSDMFKNFGFHFDFGEEAEDVVRKGDDVIMQLEITLRDAYVGRDIEILREKAILVTTSGTRDCKCRQEIRTRQLGPGMFQQFQTQVCEKCPNVRFESEDDIMTVHVKPGMDTGQEIEFFEEGEPLIDGDPGDLKFVVNLLPDDRFDRKKNDLYMDYTISLVDALTGFSKQVTHLDGHTFTLSSQNVTHPGQEMEIPGEGMPVFHSDNRKGSLFVTFTIDFPSQLSASQQTEIKKLLGSN